MDPTQLIRHDHQEIDRLFKRMERALSEHDTREAENVLRDIIRVLSVHAAIEEQFLYPSLRNLRPQDDVLDAIEEHHAVKLTLSELEATPPSDARFASKARLLMANVREHIEEEERELLPALGRALEPDQQRDLAAALANAKLLSPTRPHPSAPEMPPGNLLAGPIVGAVDRLRDSVRDRAVEIQRYTITAAEAAVILFRRLSSGAERRGREAVGGLATRTRIAAEEAREAGRRTIEQAAGRSTEAARQIRASTPAAPRRSRRIRRARGAA